MLFYISLNDLEKGVRSQVAKTTADTELAITGKTVTEKNSRNVFSATSYYETLCMHKQSRALHGLFLL